jgi:hypothetical protein
LTAPIPEASAPEAQRDRYHRQRKENTLVDLGPGRAEVACIAGLRVLGSLLHLLLGKTVHGDQELKNND